MQSKDLKPRVEHQRDENNNKNKQKPITIPVPILTQCIARSIRNLWCTEHYHSKQTSNPV